MEEWIEARDELRVFCRKMWYSRNSLKIKNGMLT